MKKILITGASGFIGSFLVEEALKKGMETWAGVRSSSSREYLQDERIHLIDMNFGDKEKLKKQIEVHVAQFGKWDYIIHNAGVTKCLNTEDFNKVNYTYTQHFVEALIEANHIPQKFILMSSLSAHSPAQTAYGQSKLKAESVLKSQSEIPYIILRPTGVYGPREKDYFLMLKTIQSGLDVSAGLETQQLTFIYVKDLVKAAFLALESSVRNRAYFVADGDVYTDQAYSRIAQKALGKKHVFHICIPLPILKGISILVEMGSKIIKKPSTLNRDKYKIMAQRDWTCDIYPIKRDLKFRADYSLEDGMRECVNWYRQEKWL